MANSEGTCQPTSVTPPGATLSDLLEERGMSQVELARRMALPEEIIRGIIHDNAAVTLEAALQLEKVFGVPASFWVVRSTSRAS